MSRFERDTDMTTFTVISETNTLALVKATNKRFAGLLNSHTFIVQRAHVILNLDTDAGTFEDRIEDVMTFDSAKEAEKAFERMTFFDPGFGVF